MMDEYIDDDGNVIIAIACEECGNIVGYINEGEKAPTIWCNMCLSAEYKEELRKVKEPGK